MSKTDIVTKSLDLAGRALTFEVGRLALRATSAVLARYGDTSVLVAVTIGKEDLKKDYFPLSVDYQERLYAGGRIKGSRWVKREGRPTDAEVLSGRLIDRSIRPHFPASFKKEVQVIITVLSVDTKNDADVLGIVAASAVLAISPIPWAGPVGAVRIGLAEGKLIVNPENGNRQGTDLDLVVTSTDKLICMLEAGAKQISEDVVYSAFETAHSENQHIIKLVSDLAEAVGQDKFSFKEPEFDSGLVAQISRDAKDMIADYVSSASTKEGVDIGAAISQLSQSVEDKLKVQVPLIVEDLLHKTIRQNILDKSQRPDDRLGK